MTIFLVFLLIVCVFGLGLYLLTAEDDDDDIDFLAAASVDMDDEFAEPLDIEVDDDRIFLHQGESLIEVPFTKRDEFIAKLAGIPKPVEEAA
jgi:hypothetical protein